MSARATASRLLTGPGSATRIAGAVLLGLTVAVQHPNTAFNRLHRKDTLSLLPNWRFFAPTPAMFDYHLLYRTLDRDGGTSPWRDIDVIAGRRPHQAVWFAARRQEKAVFDICSEILRFLDRGFPYVVNLPAYRTLLGYLRVRMAAEGSGDARGFQFTLLKSAGYDTTVEPVPLFVSPYVPMRSAAEFGISEREEE